MAIASGICDATDHNKFCLSSPPVFAHCKQSKTGGVEGLGMWLGYTVTNPVNRHDNQSPLGKHVRKGSLLHSGKLLRVLTVTVFADRLQIKSSKF